MNRDKKGKFIKGSKPFFSTEHKKRISEGLQKAHKERGYSKKEKNANWKGGRFTDVHGYVWVRVEDNHPYAYRGYMREHRRLVEDSIGRYLKPEEVVHHIDGNKINNKIENLKLLENASAHHREHFLEKTGFYKKYIKSNK